MNFLQFTLSFEQALGFAQLLTKILLYAEEMFLWSREQPARKSDLAAICDPIV
jgi:hypothetical protein